MGPAGTLTRKRTGDNGPYVIDFNWRVNKFRLPDGHLCEKSVRLAPV